MLAHRKQKNERWVDKNHDDLDHHGYSTNDYEYLDSLNKCRAIDHRTKDAVSPVKNQLTCGSCWAHNTLATIENLHAIEHPTAPFLDLSEQQLVDCNHFPNLGCWGGESIYAFDYVKEHGIAAEDRFPYLNDFKTCKYDEEVDKVY